MILGIIQARLSSRRLPGKVLLPLANKPMLLRQLERARQSLLVERWVVATSLQADDEPIASLCQENDIPCFRGSLDDVLERFYQAALPYEPLHVVRLTADCPLVDPALIDGIVRLHKMGAHDYTSNAHPPTFPNGLDCEIVKFGALAVAHREAVAPFEREHVLPFIWRRPERFSLGSFVNNESMPDYRLTVDHPEDYEVVRSVFESLYPGNPRFSFSDICTFLALHPQLVQKNSMFTRNAPLAKQVAEWDEQAQTAFVSLPQ